MGIPLDNYRLDDGKCRWTIQAPGHLLPLLPLLPRSNEHYPDQIPLKISSLQYIPHVSSHISLFSAFRSGLALTLLCFFFFFLKRAA